MITHSTTKERRRERVRIRKNYLPTLLVTLVLWALIASLIYLVDPTYPGVVFLFFLLLFLAFLFTFSVIFANRRRGLVVTVSLTVFLILRYFGIGNILNLILILALATTFELYFGRIK